jgi:ABC-type polysaccharide/polyol phosphate transport system ATPase subunit
MSEVLVKVEGVSKKFCRSLKRSLWYGVQDICADLNPFRGNESLVKTHSLSAAALTHTPNTNGAAASSSSPLDISKEHSQNGLRRDEFWAVNDVSFEVKRGECLGLIGHNGAGKTTLLKMLNGLIKPDKGRIEMHGHVGALIALGAGFNPILTGRENIYVNGAVLGLTKREIDKKIDDIIDFAEIRKFIDTPVQSYSSGMQVRLGFSVAATLKPNVLLVDEVLAVGDYRFMSKCYKRIHELRRNGTAIILVSHQLQTISNFSTRTVLMHNGQVRAIGPTAQVLDQYQLGNTEEQSVQRHEVVEEGISVSVILPPGKTRLISGRALQLAVAFHDRVPARICCEVSFKDSGGKLLMREKSPYASAISSPIIFYLTIEQFPLRTSPLTIGASFWDDTSVLLAWNPICSHLEIADSDTTLGIVTAQCSWSSSQGSLGMADSEMTKDL